MKYQGSKRRIAKEILPIMLDGMEEGDYFVDAFCGGCNLLDKVPSKFKRIANDKNKYLIAMWVRLTRYGWQPPMRIDRDIYNIYRDEFNKRKYNDNSSISFLDAEIGWYFSDYTDIPLPEKATIYCDIPYKGTKQYSTSKDFDYSKFYDWCRQKHSEGYRVFISEYQMPDDFKCIWQKQATCAMNQTITKKPIEKLFTL